MGSPGSAQPVFVLPQARRSFKTLILSAALLLGAALYFVHSGGRIELTVGYTEASQTTAPTNAATTSPSPASNRQLPINHKYNTTSGYDPNAPINLHLVAHTHDDVGWLVTVDQYYYGFRKNEFGGGVQYIIDTVIEQLLENPDRKFIYVEMAFFTRWWDEQEEGTRQIVRDLVRNGQLVFVNGGWAMNDEASVHYVATIDQMTRGHNFLLKEFGIRPRIGWHVDPFGHSSVQAALFAQMNFDAFFLGRIDHDDISKRRREKTLEFVWDPSKNLKEQAEIFTAVMYSHYCPPGGFWLENDTPVVDNPKSKDYNVQARVDEFVAQAQQYAAAMGTNNVMFPMGCDFTYSNAIMWFKQMDKLIHYANKDGRVNAFYSTPEMYIDAVYKSGKGVWTRKTDDFFPYSDSWHSYWTGYFTSRPALKLYERVGMAHLQACRQLEYVSGGPQPTCSSDSLEDAISLVQHHDGVSGTSKQAVAEDYALRISEGIAQCDDIINHALSNSLSDPKGRFIPNNVNGPTLTQCKGMNLSVCAVTQEAKEGFTVVAYNGLATERCEAIRIPVSFSAATVFAGDGPGSNVTATPVSAETKRIRGDEVGSTHELSFVGCVPALGYTTFRIQAASEQQMPTYSNKKAARITVNEDTVSLDNDNVRVVVSKQTGGIQSIKLHGEKPVEVTLRQGFHYYVSSTGTRDDGQPSGAYIFRPADQQPKPLLDVDALDVEVVGSEIRVQINPWLSQVVRVQPLTHHVEVEITAGPVDVANGEGKEIIVRYETDIASAGVFYTDANGKEMQERRINHRPTWPLVSTEPVSQNYYPVNSRIYLKDGDSQFTIVTDRTFGGSSLNDGNLEVMIHRRTLRDDNRGVGEPINEPGLQNSGGLVVRTTQYLIVDHPSTSAARHRYLAQALTYPLVLAFTTDKVPLKALTILEELLPPNVHVVTLKALNANTVLLRLEHIFEIGEDAEFSQAAEVDLSTLFDPFMFGRVVSATEKSLSANSDYIERVRPWLSDAEQLNITRSRAPTRANTGTRVTLNPMQIRTFEVVFDMA
eukprot:comp24234_c1_seq1/m.44725 comp24234_c1_seq1/g.44725  ORF comp24234_c1_seq1/g.44725 comp24234_c1_seq1/m.44725 type:complete len:1042 (-) comp24234_c1_seq1:530-3655(-)